MHGHPRPTYTLHARRRMAQRHISEAEVEDVLSNYHTSYADVNGTPVHIGHPNGRRIKVVTALGSNPPHVITTAD